MITRKMKWKLLLSMLLIYLVFQFVHIYITESPIAYSIPDKCQKLPSSIHANDEITNEHKQNIRKSVKECFPHDMTFLVYNHNRDCAIIGNGGILTGSKCGKNINEHDFVIRSNLAPIEDYEEDVGVKANITVLNTEIIRQVTDTINQINGSLGDKFLSRIRYLNNSILWYSKDTRVKFKSTKKLLNLINLLKDKYNLEIRFAYSWKSVGPLAQWFWDIDVQHPTTGLNMFTVAASLCNNITLYGFYPFYKDSKGNSLQYHYYDKINVDLQSHKTHNMPREYELLKKLNHSGILSLVTDCGQ